MDRWAAKHGLGRSEAIRALIEQRLKKWAVAAEAHHFREGSLSEGNAGQRRVIKRERLAARQVAARGDATWSKLLAEVPSER